MDDDRITEAIRNTAIGLANQGYEHDDISASLLHEACAEFGFFMYASGYCSDEEAAAISCRVDKAVIEAFNAATREELANAGRRN